MCQYVETMCARNGIIDLIDYHNERMNRTRRELFGQSNFINLNEMVKPDSNATCLKVRVVYDKEGISQITYSPYTPKNISMLRMVTCNDIDYTYKSTDRSKLAAIASQKGDCDEVLIVKEGLITDTSYTNVAVLKDGKWLTPRQPLLKGTRRAYLLDRGLITEEDISPNDINLNTEIMLFNGMMDFGTCRARLKL